MVYRALRYYTMACSITLKAVPLNLKPTKSCIHSLQGYMMYDPYNGRYTCDCKILDSTETNMFLGCYRPLYILITSLDICRVMCERDEDVGLVRLIETETRSLQPWLIIVIWHLLFSVFFRVINSKKHWKLNTLYC